MGVFFEVWFLGCIRSISICRGVLDSNRNRWVSVVCLTGIMFRITMRWGLISWWMALDWSITKMFSFFRTAAAGRLSGILMGIMNDY